MGNSRWLWLVLVAACGGGNTLTPPDAATTSDAPGVDAPSPDGAIFPEVTPAPACTGTPLLPAIAIPRVGRGPTRSTLGDFNGDGKTDIATVNTYSDSVSILIGRGDGSFLPAVDYPAGSGPRAIASADVDGDLDLDLLLLLPTTAELVVLRNDGLGGFATTAAYATSTGPGLLVVGDIDNDGDVDAVTLNRTATFTFVVGVMRGDGTGAFGAPTTDPAGFNPVALVLADVDGTGALDIVLADREGEYVSVLRNTGTGTFQARESHPTGYELGAVAAGDVDGDTKIDLVVAAASNNGGLRYLRGNGDGTFLAPVQISTHSVIEVAIADIDADGKLDVVGQNWDVVVTLPGLGNGTFGSERVVAGQYESRMAIGRLDSNAQLDIALTLYGADAIDILLADSAGAFRTLPSFVVQNSTFGSVNAIASADFDGNGSLDLAVLGSDNTTFTLHILSGNGLGGFTETATLSSSYGTSLFVVDLDGDARLDLLTASAIYRNAPTGWSQTIIDSGLTNARNALASDLNADGRIDLAFGGLQGWAVRLGSAAGFLAPIVQTEPILVSQAVDVNGDGKRDLLSVSPIGGAPELRLGNGDGTFQAAGTVTGSLAADFDADGKLDLAGLLGLARGNGDGTFQAVVPYALDLEYLAEMKAVDLDRDGKLDLVALNGYGTMSFVRGNGNGTFQPRLVYGTAGQETAFALGDYDRSGTLDIATIGYGRSVKLFWQTGCLP